jgi:hypothetical protein
MSDLTTITELVMYCAYSAARASEDTFGSMADHPSLQIYIYEEESESNLNIFLLTEYVQIGLKTLCHFSTQSPPCASASLMPGFHDKKTPLTDCVATYAPPLLSRRPY